MDRYIKLFISEHRARESSLRTTEGYRADLERFRSYLHREGHPTELEEIRREHVLGWLTEMVNHRSERTTNPAGSAAIRFRSLRTFMNWAAENEIIPASPMRRLKAPRVPEAPVPILEEEQLRALLDTCRKGKSPEERRDYALLRVFCDRGPPRHTARIRPAARVAVSAAGHGRRQRRRGVLGCLLPRGARLAGVAVAAVVAWGRHPADARTGRRPEEQLHDHRRGAGRAGGAKRPSASRPGLPA